MAPTKNEKKRAAKGTAQAAKPHASRGGSRGYPKETREAAMAVRDRNEENEPTFIHLRATKKWPSRATTRGWHRRRVTLGHLRPFVRQGNKPATVLRGYHRFLLMYYRTLYPKALASEVNAFLFNSMPDPTPRFFHPSQITRAEDALGLSRKCGATIARQANLPINLLKRELFWNRQYPFGIGGIRRDDLNDTDEAAIYLETANRGYGKVFIGKRLEEEGLYGHMEKYTLLFTMGSTGLKIALFERLKGVTVPIFADHIQQVLNAIGPGTPGNRKCFLMYNLSVHKNPLISQMINLAGHRLLFRAPYKPKDGPIEFLFNTIQQELTRRLHRIFNFQELEREMNAIIQQLGNLEQYFIHCGYTFN